MKQLQLSFKTNRAGLMYLVCGKEVIAKECSRCSEVKGLDKFNKAGRGFVGKHSACKDCHRKRDAGGRLS